MIMCVFWYGVDLLFQAFFSSCLQIILNLNLKLKGFINSPEQYDIFQKYFLGCLGDGDKAYNHVDGF